MSETKLKISIRLPRELEIRIEEFASQRSLNRNDAIVQLLQKGIQIDNQGFAKSECNLQNKTD